MIVHPADRPKAVVWDVTYACPLRCVHCYSESGRRPTRQLDLDGMIDVADGIIAMGVELVSLAGGEPLTVKGIFEVAQRFHDAGVVVAMSTSGWPFHEGLLADLARVCRLLSVSVDGATPDVHDRIRGRQGSFERAMNTLTTLDRARAEGGDSVPFGIDCTVTRGGFGQLDDFCTVLAPRFPRLRSISFGAVIPTGLASRVGFAEHELLTDDQMAEFGSAAFAARLRALAPASVRIDVSDYLDFRMSPDRIAQGPVFEVMFIEPDGEVRGMPVYEGTVGNIRTEPGDVLWRRCTARRGDPFVTRTLSEVRTVQDWAAAVRRIDRHFGTDQVRSRIDRRPEFSVLASH